ncbi:MAG: ABC transporter ATP-binding protein [Microbacteriaceae bacterium]|nr:ABC transporter ATP-binding protein [Microbacteriaceae bacterium]
MLGKLLVRFLKSKWALIIAIIVFQTGQSIAALWLPTLNADIIDDGVVVGDIAYIWSTGGIMLLISLAQVICSVIAVYFGARLAMGFGRDLRASLFNKVVSYSQQEIGQFGAPSLITRNTNDVQQVQMLVQMTATMMISAPIMATGGVIMAIRQDVGLSWLMAVAMPLLLIVVAAIAIRLVPSFTKMQKRIDRVNQVLREQLSGIRVVRAFVREREEKTRFFKASGDVMEMGVVTGNLMALMFPVVMLVMNVSTVAIIWFGGFQVDSGDAQIGTLFAFLSYMMQILMSVMMATFMFIMIPRAAVSAKRIGEALETEPSVTSPAKPVALPATTSGKIEFENVSFTYPGAEDAVLHNLTFTVNPGETTAIIGSTGSGKTTLIGLVPRLFDATEGRVLIDGVDARDYDPNDLWQRIGLIPQRAFLFSGTVASNLRYGGENATDEDLWRALKIAQAEDFVKQMPGELDAEISQGGTNVSGGQRQRLSIARALVKDPEILIFDDSFSALDLRTDAALRAAINKKLPHTTRLVVAQRVSTIQNADQIIVLEHGRIVGVGKHEDLLETNETYREIVESQLSAEEAA